MQVYWQFLPPTCPCGEEDQTNEHVLQRCNRHQPERIAQWLSATPLNQNLYGGLEDLKKEDHQRHHCCWTGRVGEREEEEEDCCRYCTYSSALQFVDRNIYYTWNLYSLALTMVILTANQPHLYYYHTIMNDTTVYERWYSVYGHVMGKYGQKPNRYGTFIGEIPYKLYNLTYLYLVSADSCTLLFCVLVILQWLYVARSDPQPLLHPELKQLHKV